jgi:hypothetical protein
MKFIQPNCRVQFTADDIHFIISVLQPKNAKQYLIELLTDAETRDQILDDPALYRALLEQCGCLRVSMHFYFYVLVRQVLKGNGIEDRSVADYVAELLAEFSRSERRRCLVNSSALEYFVDMLAALQTADDRTRFIIRAHIGDHSLFLSGVFPARIRSRAEDRGCPDLSYYEALGRANYRAASDHRLAHKYDLAPIFNRLADEFGTMRMALNDLSDRIFTLHEGDPVWQSLLN